MPVVALPFPADHPAFLGHFPSLPIVPGVLLLDWVQTKVESYVCHCVCTLVDAKFHAPATPADVLEVDFDVGPKFVRFEVRSGSRKIASGRFGLPGST